jgi:WD40 repeat protein
MRHEDVVWAVAFSPDGKLLASGSRDGTARLWEVASGRLHGQPLQTMKHWALCKVAFSSDGKLLATMVWDVAGLWDVETGRLHAKLQVHPYHRWLVDLAFSPDGKLLATAYLDRIAQLWDTTTGEPHGEPLRHGGRVLSVAFSPDGKLLASGSSDQTVRLWEIPSVQPCGQPLRHQAGVGKVAFSPDGKFLAAASRKGGTTQIWRTHPQIRMRVGAQPRGLGASVISPDGKLEAVISGKVVQLRDTTTGKAYGPKLPHDDRVTAAAFSPDGELLAAGTWNGVWRSQVKIWQVATGQVVVPALETEEVLALAFSSDGKLLAKGSTGLRAHVFEVDTGRRLHELWCDDWAHAVAFSPDNKVLATGTRAGTVHLWDMPTGRQLSAPLRHGDAVGRVAFSPDGSLLASASGESGENVALRVWDVTTGPPYQGLTVPGGKIDAKTALGLFNPDGAPVLDKSTDGTIPVWRLPAAPADPEEMQLRTWVATGARRSNGEVAAIPWQEWQKLRDELRNLSAGKKAGMTSGKEVVPEKTDDRK